jgi:hypothetical protein
LLRVGPNNVLAKELAVLCATNTKIVSSLASIQDETAELGASDDLINNAGESGAAEIDMELSKRREFLRFPIYAL